MKIGVNVILWSLTANRNVQRAHRLLPYRPLLRALKLCSGSLYPRTRRDDDDHRTVDVLWPLVTGPLWNTVSR